MRRALFIPFPAVIIAVACSSEAPAPSPDARQGPTPPLVTDSRTDLVISWFGDAGAAVAGSVAEVPDEARAEVRVQDPTVPPEDRDPAWVFLADLRQPGPDGSYSVRAEPRERYEARRAAATARSAAAAKIKQAPPDISGQGAIAAPAGLVMYSTRHCPVCHKARRWLLDQGFPYTEKDIERDPAAAAELRALGTAQGVPTSGVPVFSVGGRLVPGFDKRALTRLIRALPTVPKAI